MKIPIEKSIRLQSEIDCDKWLSEPLIPGEKPFSSFNVVNNVSHLQVQEVRKWKNRVIEIRDLYKGTDSYNIWDDEAKRLVKFLNKFK